jgi:hypothetical protein
MRSGPAWQVLDNVLVGVLGVGPPIWGLKPATPYTNSTLGNESEDGPTWVESLGRNREGDPAARGGRSLLAFLIPLHHMNVTRFVL